MSLLTLFYTQLSCVSMGLVSCIFHIMCTAIHNCLSSGSLVFATDVELYENVTNIVYNYDTLLQQTFTLITTMI